MLKSKLDLKLTGIILGILVVGAIYLIKEEYVLTKKEINNLLRLETASSERMLEQVTQKRVSCVIDRGDGRVNLYQIIPSESLTVFSLLKKLAQMENFKIEFTIYEGTGVLIESIDGVRNGTDNKYWQYWLNEELPMIAADKKEIKGGDKVEWKFAPSLF